MNVWILITLFTAAQHPTHQNCNELRRALMVVAVQDINTNPKDREDRGVEGENKP